MCARRRTYLLLRRQKKVGQEKATPLPVSPSYCVRGGSLRCSVLGCAAELAAFFELRSISCGKPDNDARVLRHALTPGPALLGTVRRGWERAPLGPLLRSARCAVAALGLGRAATPPVGSAQRVTDTRRSCEAAAGWTPLPTPSGCAEKRRSWGGCVCRRTHALRDLTCRSCLSGVRRTQRVLRHHPRSEHRRLPPFARQGEWGTQTGGRLFFAYFLLATQKKVGAPPGAHPGSRPPPRHGATMHTSTSKPEKRQAHGL